MRAKGEGRPVHVLHDEVARRLMGVDALHGDDVRVLDALGDPGFALEAAHRRRIGGSPGMIAELAPSRPGERPWRAPFCATRRSTFLMSPPFRWKTMKSRCFSSPWKVSVARRQSL